MSHRARLLASSAIGCGIKAIRTLELFMLQSLKNNAWNSSAGVHWLANNPYPTIYTATVSPTGRMDIICETGLVGTAFTWNGQRELWAGLQKAPA